GPPRRAIHGPARLNRRPAGLPAAQYLRSASGLLGQSDQDQDQKHGGLKADLSVESQIKSQSCSSVGAGLPAMLTTRCIRYTQLMPSR
ncbi:MAG: hypothetical protein ACRESM_28355, partial [Pseudomonas sp.]